MALMGRGDQNLYLQSQAAWPASDWATLSNAKSRAMRGVDRRSSLTVSSRIWFHMPGGSGVPAPPAQYSATFFCSEVSFLEVSRTSWASAVNCGLP